MRSNSPFFAFWALLLVAGVAAATTTSQRQGAERPNREELQGMMEAYVLSKLQDALELTDEQFGRMVVAQKKLSDVRREHRRRRGEALRDLREILRRPDTSEDEIQPILDELEELRADFQEEEKARYRDIDAILDIRQRARYRILEVELQRRLQQLIRRVRNREPPDPGFP